MSTFKATSWGRTRTPKNILSNFRSGINSGGDALAVSGSTSALFKTENQRYLVLEVSALAGGNVVINGKMTAGSGTARTLSPQPTISAIGLYIIEIDGIDEVSFTTTQAASLYAACSTF